MTAEWPLPTIIGFCFTAIRASQWVHLIIGPSVSPPIYWSSFCKNQNSLCVCTLCVYTLCAQCVYVLYVLWMQVHVYVPVCVCVLCVCMSVVIFVCESVFVCTCKCTCMQQGHMVVRAGTFLDASSHL